MLVDIHAHLDAKQFEADLDKVIQRAKESDIKAVINNGLNFDTNIKTLELSKRHDIIKPALGLYPVDAENLSEIQIQEILAQIQKNKSKIVAIGEVGLDFSYTKDTKKQTETFSEIINLAEKIKKPIIVHSRKAEQKVIEMLSSSSIKHKILHSFGGSKDQIRLAQENNFYFSIPPSIVRSSNFQTLVSMVSISSILTESDAPYLGISKEKRNEPSDIIYTIKKISQIKNFDVVETKTTIFSNYQKIFLIET